VPNRPDKTKFPTPPNSAPPLLTPQKDQRHSQVGKAFTAPPR